MNRQTIFSALLFFSFFFISHTSNAQANAGGATAAGSTQDCGPINAGKLKELLTQLGHSTKDLVTTPGKEKYEVKVNSNGFDVPIGFEISPSTNYIWLTVFLGKASGDTASTYSLIKQNAKIQPAFFYITDSNNLMLGLPVDNRGLNTMHLKRYIDFIAGKVGTTKVYWNK